MVRPSEKVEDGFLLANKTLGQFPFGPVAVRFSQTALHRVKIESTVQAGQTFEDMLPGSARWRQRLYKTCPRSTSSTKPRPCTTKTLSPPTSPEASADADCGAVDSIRDMDVAVLRIVCF